MHHKHGVYATASEETFDCDNCGKSFSSRRYLKAHQRAAHVDEEVKCEVCKKICKNRILLRCHRRTHVKAECPICRNMVSECYMNNHMRAHLTENHFKCDICVLSSKTKSDLRKHIERSLLLKQLMDDSKYREDLATSICLKSFALGSEAHP